MCSIQKPILFKKKLLYNINLIKCIRPIEMYSTLLKCIQPIKVYSPYLNVFYLLKCIQPIEMY